jgi:hypothetical protein
MAGAAARTGRGAVIRNVITRKMAAICFPKIVLFIDPLSFIIMILVSAFETMTISPPGDADNSHVVNQVRFSFIRVEPDSERVHRFCCPKIQGAALGGTP